MQRHRLALILVCLALSACSPKAIQAPTDLASIEDAFGVAICDGSNVTLIDDIGIVSPSPVYNIGFPNAKCVDIFLQSLTEGSVYEHPFGDETKLLGSNEKKKIQFTTIRESDHSVTFGVKDISRLIKS